MRFLFVSCFKAGAAGQTQLHQLVKLVKNTIDASPNVNDINNDYLLVDDLDQIDRFLLDTSFSASEQKSQAFDIIDLVFVLSDYSRPPWAAGNRKVGRSQRRF